jgi:hypothetical protein
MPDCSMSYSHYRGILSAVLNAEYSFRTFGQGAPATQTEHVFYMRHDIDVDPYAALRMAQIEAEFGVRATYFFLPTAPYYNVMAPPVREVLREIENLGGDVQLHFDAGPFAGDALSDVEAEIECQSDWLSHALESKEITAVSFHRPATAVIGCDLTGFTSAYSPRFFGEMHYISDSAGSWRDGCVCSIIGRLKQIHCLIHPVWWAGEQHQSIAEAVRLTLDDVSSRMDEWLEQEIRSYSRCDRQGSQDLGSARRESLSGSRP